jgi:hypothetical protein
LPSTPNTADSDEGWLGLLRKLDDAELAKYGEIAHDQYRRELRFWWAQVLLMLLALAGLGLTVRGIILWGYSRTGVLSLGLSALLSYWPYRSAKVRRLWGGHLKAVRAEQSRRADVRAALVGSERGGGR